MTDKAIVFIGHSHLGPIREGLSSLEVGDRPGTRARFYVHEVWQKNAQYADSNSADGLKFNSDVLDLIRTVVPVDAERHYVTALGGNAHILLALAEHPRPFDFVLPEKPDLPTEASAELIPFQYFMQALKPLMLPYVWQLLAFRAAIDGRVLCLETPPPYGDQAYVTTHIGSYVPDPNKIVSRWLRYKAWRAHSWWLRYFCEANDIEFVSVPTQAVNGGGFMVREGYGMDATHANSWYGQLVARQIEQRFDVVYDGWQLFS